MASKLPGRQVGFGHFEDDDQDDDLAAQVEAIQERGERALK